MKEYHIFVGEGGAFALGGPITSCGVMYIGYRENGSPITEERGRVLFDGDEEYYKNFSKLIQEYEVIHILADKQKNTFYVKELLSPNAQPLPDEQKFLAQQALPVTFTDEEFGEFCLDKSVNWFEGSLLIEEQIISVNLDEKKDIETLRTLKKDMPELLKRAGIYAAEILLDLGNDWCYDTWADEAGEDADENDYIPKTNEDFIKRISLTSITISDNGCYTLWYDDGDIFWGHSICVEGSIKKGFYNASMQG